MGDERDPVAVAEWYVEIGRAREALDALRDADPMNFRTAELRARALLVLGRFAEAEEQARQALAFFPEDVSLLALLASVQMATNAEVAEATVLDGLKLDPENLRLLQLGVIVRLQQGKYEAAETMLERAMRISPDQCQGVRTLFLLAASESSEAREASRELLRQFPDEAYSHYIAGLAALNGPWWRGMRHLREAAALRPDDPVIVETARGMRAWYMWPIHLTSGVVHYVVTIILAVPALYFAFVRGDYTIFVVMLAFTGLKWLAYFAGKISIQRRIERALRER